MSLGNEQSIEERIQQETGKRLEIMGKPDYPFPQQLKKIDWLAIIITILLCLILIAACMLEDL